MAPLRNSATSGKLRHVQDINQIHLELGQFEFYLEEHRRNCSGNNSPKIYAEQMWDVRWGVNHSIPLLSGPQFPVTPLSRESRPNSGLAINFTQPSTILIFM